MIASQGRSVAKSSSCSRNNAQAGQIAMPAPDDECRPRYWRCGPRQQLGVGCSWSRCVAATTIGPTSDIKAADAGGLFVASHAMFCRDHRAIVALAAQCKIPASTNGPTGTAGRRIDGLWTE